MTRDGEVVNNPIIESDKVLTFPRGIPGFEKYTTYIVYHKEENDISAFWLESCDDPSVTFTLVDPGQYGLSYELELTDEERDLLQAEKAEELGIFMVLSKKEAGAKAMPIINANIIGPIIINPRTQLALQKVIFRSRVQATIVQEN
ncbi:flagellar assembly protein FliW [Desulfopila sp. IMCC35006]|uniref:flagellar assembly protein FliW n=1 Tax=Desulfopila sp. IMCC35006 TaxID=2569542 RepID=UPI0010AD48EB|nr:flagellar assembly protein FliW [Desulfopila sp. IMCC35006]TKB23663.1 flagellar assembly protein FliW [Desulfopila sp. IMCC35006]